MAPAAYTLATPEARAAYDKAKERAEEAWQAWDKVARMLSPGEPLPGEWRAYTATLGPLEDARRALLAFAEQPAQPEPERVPVALTLFDVEA
jgi:hypothetical protein